MLRHFPSCSIGEADEECTFAPPVNESRANLLRGQWNKHCLGALNSALNRYQRRGEQLKQGDRLHSVGVFLLSTNENACDGGMVCSAEGVKTRIVRRLRAECNKWFSRRGDHSKMPLQRTLTICLERETI